MTQSILRVLIQERLANGHLPHAHIPRTAPKDNPAMSKGLLRGLTLAAFAALGTMTCVASAGAATPIDSCRTLSTFGGSYVLASDLESCGTCLVVANDRITIDLAGHTIAGSCALRHREYGRNHGCHGWRVPGTRRQGTTVKNGTITGFDDRRFSRRQAPAIAYAISHRPAIPRWDLRRRSQSREGLCDRGQWLLRHPHRGVWSGSGLHGLRPRGCRHLR